ncbi:ABC transporter permease [Clostridium sp. D2Q-14]|uniref:ABC transporter permease n=1 Tax=Anaeromonas gelatinilytica TaxID=2683194 RepID=UPI00193B798B|nr:ABC transporter permease [Anaeromonas gelatinilytica]MBS4536765.1 ABC transporter permease [Anaeromonas gelatinilytica]
MNSFFDTIFTSDFVFSTIRVTTPILFAALGALISNKAGSPNIGLEGIMLMSALGGVVFSAYTGSAFIGLLGAVLVGLISASILAYFTLKLKTDVILGGIAINFFADGGTIFLLYYLTGDKGTSSSLPSKVLPNIDLPIIQNIPVLGDIISGHNILTYVAIILIIGVWYLLNKTATGLRIKSVGENEDAAKSVGVNIMKVRYLAMALSGVFAGLGGAFLSMGYVSWFSRGMSAGRGWIALAAEAMGRGTVLGTTLSSILFGAADALSNTLQLLGIPSELISIIPYLATVIGLLIYAINNTKKRKLKE